MSLIKLTNVNKIYGAHDYQTIALNNIDLTIEAGELVAIIGPSGSGKSTLMHILGLLDRPSEGDYEFEKHNVASLSDDKRAHLRLNSVGFVFQTFNLLGRTTALENVMLPMIYSKRNRSSREKRAAELLKQVGLGDRMHHMPNELSGGQVQRVAIARALANKPEIIMADEPTGNLDSKSGQQILELLQELNNKGNTLVLVTHDNEVAKLANRIITMRDGQIVSDKPNKKKPKRKAAKATKSATKSTKKTAPKKTSGQKSTSKGTRKKS